jgi:hypothetical protein
VESFAPILKKGGSGKKFVKKDTLHTLLHKNYTEPKNAERNAADVSPPDHNSMSFIQDSRHFTFSSSRAILHDVTTSTFIWDSASLFSVSAPASAVYATVACESFSCINGFYSVTTRNNCIAVDSFTQLFIPEGFYTGISLARPSFDRCWAARSHAHIRRVLAKSRWRIPRTLPSLGG